MIKRIYLDHAAATYLDKRVRRAMNSFWEENFGNPSSLYKEGRKAKKALDQARAGIASLINARPDEIIFTGSGTESDNLAIFGIAKALGVPISKPKGHIITTKIEHHAILNAVENLEEEGFEATYLNVDKNGLVDPIDVKKALRPDTALVSVIYANNEIGTIQPIAEISEIIKEYRKNKMGIQEKTPFFHSDACQAAGYLEMDVEKLGVDLMTVNGSKIYGPKGIGFLYVRSGVKLKPIIYGGGQEKGLRSGTENLAAIVGLAEAFKIAQQERKKESARLIKLRDKLAQGILKTIPKTVLNGHPEKRLPNNVNVSILDIEGESTMLYLDARGIAVSTGSACTSRSLEPSHVISALGRPFEYGHSSLRLTLGRKTSKKEIDYVLKILPEVAGILRKISPFLLKAKK
ncbi:MAG: cysteine desulfurase [Candidatus Niyogibacteria bacterium]|nr:cysteine desulfurase [Candidatus Niyogibacteria bacterium]